MSTTGDEVSASPEWVRNREAKTGLVINGPHTGARVEASRIRSHPVRGTFT